MKSKIEILAPGGDIDSIKAAILAGADAIYCGLERFNARNSATNIQLDDLYGIIQLAHKNYWQVYLTLNILILDSEIPALFTLLNKLVNTGIDGVIIQDLGLFYILSKYFKNLKIHASTQLTTHNTGQINFLSKLNATQVNLSRELNIHEIKELTSHAKNYNILTEVFVHGSLCLSFSGICYLSSVHGGNSGNRGRCSQPCRDQFKTTPAGKNYPLNLKDNSAYFDIKELADAGVSSFKIEGRIKKFDYVYTVVRAWRKQLNHLYNNEKINTNNSDLYQVFNRDFTNSYLKGDFHKNMFIDNPRDHSVQHLSEIKNYNSNNDLEKDQLAFYTEKENNKTEIESKIKKFNIDKIPLTLIISGSNANPLIVNVKTPDTSFQILSGSKLSNTGSDPIHYDMLFKRLKAINETAYCIKDIELDHFADNLYIPFKELTAIKKKILFVLNDSKEYIEPVNTAILIKHKPETNKPNLSVLISSTQDAKLCNETTTNIYFQLPNSLNNKCAEFVDLFLENPQITPWFPSVLIGENYKAAVEILKKISPSNIVTNNTGIAFEAYERGIPWIAGPQLNIVNSFSLLSLKENFNCKGAFISNEINRTQLKRIKKPENFNLFYSIYHPIELMTSRPCLFHQVTGCEKESMDDTCIQSCNKSASISNEKNDTLYIEKTKGNYHTLYNQNNYLNTGIIKDLPYLFSSFLIDLRDIKTDTKTGLNKTETIQLFESFIDSDLNSKEIYSQKMSELKNVIHPTTNTQYKKGI